MMPLLTFSSTSEIHPPWFPGASFQRIAQYTRDTFPDVRDVPYSNTKAQMVTLFSPGHAS